MTTVERRGTGLADERLVLILRESARVSSLVASYCDRTTHNEPSDAESLSSAGRRLRDLSTFLADALDVDLIEAYASRLEHIERRSAMEPLLPSPAETARIARSWRDLQLAQLRHDRHFHPDVFGLSKRDQVLHVALHLSKLTGAIALLLDEDTPTVPDFARRRLPDMLLFGIKLSTLANEPLAGDLTPSPEGAHTA